MFDISQKQLFENGHRKVPIQHETPPCIICPSAISTNEYIEPIPVL